MEKYYLAALAHYLGMAAPQKAATLAALFGSAQRAHQAGKGAVRRLGVSNALVEYYGSRYQENFPETLLAYCQDHKVNIITRNDACYPFLLQQIYGPPAVLYVQGKLPDNGPKFAIVGSRKATAYGLKAAKSFARVLAAADINIVSGGAYGIDGEAHRGALEGGNTTVVLGGGLAELYPPQHKKLFGEIRERGTLLTEYAPWEAPLAKYFPFRNRIIVGLCQGVLIVEAAQKSGAMLTANLALAENRDVYCLPGNIFSPTSQGTNGLIKEGARLVDTPEEIQADFSLPPKKTGVVKGREKSLFSSEPAGLNAQQKAVYNIIRSQEYITLEEIVIKVGLTIQSVSGILLELQLSGNIIQEKGNRFLAT